MRNISSDNQMYQDTLAVFQSSKWTVHIWWLLLGGVGGVLGGIFFHPQLTSRWWVSAIYLGAVFALHKAFVKIARRIFGKDFWLQVTPMFLVTFVLACLMPGISLLVTRSFIVVPILLVSTFFIGLVHSIFRIVFVRDMLAWAYAATACALISMMIGWWFFRTESSLTYAAVVGAIVGSVYPLLTSIVMTLMWDEGSSQSQFGTVLADKQGNFDEALAFHDHAIELDPHNPKLYAARADVYMKHGDLEQAREDIAYALTFDPECAEARLLRAVMMADKGDLDGAIAEYDQLVDYKWFYQDAYLHRARAYSLKGDYDRAFADYETASKSGEDGTLAFAHRAEMYYRMGEYDRAIDECTSILSMQTFTPLAWIIALVTRGKSYAAKGEDQLAANDFAVAFRSEPYNAKWMREAEEGLRALQAKQTRSLPTDEQMKTDPFSSV